MGDETVFWLYVILLIIGFVGLFISVMIFQILHDVKHNRPAGYYFKEHLNDTFDDIGE